MNLKGLSRNELLIFHRSAAKDERTSHARLIAALKENIRRELFKEMGYSSLHSFIVQELGYEGGGAARRANAAYAAFDLERASREPIEKKIERGELSISSLSHVNQILKQEKYVARRTVKMAEKKKILSAVVGKSEREAHKALCQFSSAPPPPPKTQERVVSKTRTQLSMVVDDNFYQEMQEAMHILSHVNPRMDTRELFQYLVRDFLKRKSPMRKMLRKPRGKVSRKVDRKVDSITEPAAVKQQAGLGLLGKAQAISKRRTQTDLFQSSSSTKRFTPKNQTRNSGSTARMRQGVRRARLAPNSDVSRPKTTEGSFSSIDSRAPGASLKRAVISRDGPGCSYVDPTTKKRCGSMHKCQFDHRHAYSRGGRTMLENLRVLCAVHNRYVYKTQQRFAFQKEW